MSQNFQNAKIYKITNDFNTDIYIGSTCNTLTKRFIAHKSTSKKEKNCNIPLYKLINEIGFERFRIELIEDFSCEDRYQLRQREGHFIREMGNLNKRIENRDKEEHNEIIIENTRKWRENNKEEYEEWCKQYRDKNKDKISMYRKEYYQNNKEKFRDINKTQYEIRKNK